MKHTRGLLRTYDYASTDLVIDKGIHEIVYIPGLHDLNLTKCFGYIPVDFGNRFDISLWL